MRPWGSYWSWDPKETWALITWLVFAIYLHTRLTKGWKGTGPALIATGGFVVVWICYLGVNLLGTGLHRLWMVSKIINKYARMQGPSSLGRVKDTFLPSVKDTLLSKSEGVESLHIVICTDVQS